MVRFSSPASSLKPASVTFVSRRSRFLRPGLRRCCPVSLDCCQSRSLVRFAFGEATGMLPSIFETFLNRSPICVMARAVVENLFAPTRLDELFQHTAQVQYHRTLMFSAVVELMSSVVLGVEPSVYCA